MREEQEKNLAALAETVEVKNAAASRQHRLQLQTSYGKALMLSRGFGSEEAKAAFAKSNAAVIDALKSYGAWMKSDLLPRSNGDYKLGADTFAKRIPPR